jgi:hypothetical protein
MVVHLLSLLHPQDDRPGRLKQPENFGNAPVEKKILI